MYPRKQNQQNIAGAIQFIVSSFDTGSQTIIRLLADQSPHFETPETKRRRHETFQTMLTKFWEHEEIIKKVWSQVLQAIKQEIIEEHELKEKALREYTRIENNAQIEKAASSNISKEITKEKLEANIQEAINNLRTAIQQLNEKIKELTLIEDSILINIEDRLRSIKENYQLMANETHEEIIIKYKTPATENKDNQYDNIIISLKDIYNRLRDVIPQQLRSKQIFPHQIKEKEKEEIQQNLKESIAQYINKKYPLMPAKEKEVLVIRLVSSPRFIIAVNEVAQKVENHRAAHAVAQNNFQKYVAALAIDQSDLAHIQAAKQCYIETKKSYVKKEQELNKQMQNLDQRKAALKNIVMGKLTNHQLTSINNVNEVIDQAKKNQSELKKLNTNSEEKTFTNTSSPSAATPRLNG